MKDRTRSQQKVYIEVQEFLDMKFNEIFIITKQKLEKFCKDSFFKNQLLIDKKIYTLK